MTELDLLTAHRAGRRLRQRPSSRPVEATRAALDAIAALDPAVHAFVLVDADGALAAARGSERRWRAGRPLGPFDGVPASIKDLLLTAGWPTLRGSRLLDAAGPWTEDAPAVARLRESGAVLLGKTTTPEFGWKGVTDSPRYGATGNPWDPARTAGGSSGGSAAAVGLGMGAWSVGTDGGGSVRIPAGFTGTVALKPTYGLVPMYPPSPFGTLSHAGPMTRSVRDAAALLDIISGFDPRDWSAMPTPTGSFLARCRGPTRPGRGAGRVLAAAGLRRQRPGGRGRGAGGGRRAGRGRGAGRAGRPGLRRPRAGLPRALVRRRGQGARGPQRPSSSR